MPPPPPLHRRVLSETDFKRIELIAATLRTFKWPEVKLDSCETSDFDLHPDDYRKVVKCFLKLPDEPTENWRETAYLAEASADGLRAWFKGATDTDKFRKRTPHSITTKLGWLFRKVHHYDTNLVRQWCVAGEDIMSSSWLSNIEKTTGCIRVALIRAHYSFLLNCLLPHHHRDDWTDRQRVVASVKSNALTHGLPPRKRPMPRPWAAARSFCC